MKCEECKFFHVRHIHKWKWAETCICRKYPPQCTFLDDSQPTIDRDDWCGEYEEKI